MINRLRKKFIRIAAFSVAAVMLILSIIVNVAYYLYTDQELTNMLKFIYKNQGSIPVQHHEKEPPIVGIKGYTPETPFSTRYFVLRFDEEGELDVADLSHIAAVTTEDTKNFIDIALKRGEGFGHANGYKYYVAKTGADKYMAIFLNCYSEYRSAKLVAMMSLLADMICIILVLISVVLFSKKAIEPVAKSVEKQKQFITDASHELKTPLTVITTSLKVLEMEVGEQKWINKAQAQTEKMGELVNSLVTLSRMDEENPKVFMKEFMVSEAVRETVESFVESIEAEGFELYMKIESNVKYFGDERSIRQLTSILMDNALKYSKPGGKICFTLKKEHRNIVISSSNPCDNIDKLELEKLFDRFYRTDKSRTSSGKGFGVGLSIAKSIAEIHKGTISANMIRDGVIEFKAILK